MIRLWLKSIPVNQRLRQGNEIYLIKPHKHDFDININEVTKLVCKVGILLSTIFTLNEIYMVYILSKQNK